MAYPKLVLHHYTSGSGLVGILSSNQIWATNIHALNDSKEFVHAIGLAKYAIRQALEEQMGDEVDAVYAAVENSLDSISRLSVYVSCFSEVPDSLSQWRGYCPPGFGYCIGFDGDLLSKVAYEQGFVLGKCIYEREEQERICLEWAGRTAEHLKRKLETSNDIEAVVNSAAASFWRDFYEFAPLLKHSSFHTESEWRLFGLVRSDDPRMCIRAAKSMLVRYVSIDLELSPMSEMVWDLTVGPTPHPQLGVEALTIYLKKFSIRNGIKSSETPYRDW